MSSSANRNWRKPDSKLKIKSIGHFKRKSWIWSFYLLSSALWRKASLLTETCPVNVLSHPMIKWRDNQQCSLTYFHILGRPQRTAGTGRGVPPTKIWATAPRKRNRYFSKTGGIAWGPTSKLSWPDRSHQRQLSFVVYYQPRPLRCILYIISKRIYIENNNKAYSLTRVKLTALYKHLLTNPH